MSRVESLPCRKLPLDSSFCWIISSGIFFLSGHILINTCFKAMFYKKKDVFSLLSEMSQLKMTSNNQVTAEILK